MHASRTYMCTVCLCLAALLDCQLHACISSIRCPASEAAAPGGHAGATGGATAAAVPGGVLLQSLMFEQHMLHGVCLLSSHGEMSVLWRAVLAATCMLLDQVFSVDASARCCSSWAKAIFPKEEHC